jgi:hypothetical protein
MNGLAGDLGLGDLAVETLGNRVARVQCITKEALPVRT